MLESFKIHMIFLSRAQVKKRCIGDGDGFIAYVKKAAGVAVSGSYKYIN
jgi:hypothetical protein